MFTDPTAIELVEAVTGFLRDEALPALDARHAFLARVSINALEIVARELAQGPGADRAERARVQALLTGGAGTTGESAAGLTSPPCATRDDGEPSLAALNARLCEEIAAGRIARDDPALLAHLRATTLAAVAIDQPGYSGLRLALSAAPPTAQQPPETGEER